MNDHIPWPDSAKAEIDRLRVQLAETMSLARHNEYEAQTLAREICEAEAAIDRVRELCEPGSPIRAAGLAEQVLRALDGPDRAQ